MPRTLIVLGIFVLRLYLAPPTHHCLPVSRGGLRTFEIGLCFATDKACLIVRRVPFG
ncbi:hypothetical protein HMPREF0973_01781 [Prevotella veroralis F0319]|uniref:Uncharacterized protein n=1 Tax=Prevotella veroralis F0319 TaxID=649761 RepID=C9MQ82_9BACT|nr:hypothetical protein HMPREF0973_01781 [Prevotella veroralis F0319]